MRLTDPNFFPARVKTYVAGDQVASADLNAIQDGVIGGNTSMDLLVDELEAQGEENQTATENQADSPAPNVGGAKTVWVEKSTNGTTLVLLDDSVDWRDRICIITGFVVAAASAPGGANDNVLEYNLEGGLATIHAVIYTEAGQTGAAANPGFSASVPSMIPTDTLRIFARDTDGALCMQKSANADGDSVVILEVRSSPAQNHY